jgi:hypothetical protein
MVLAALRERELGLAAPRVSAARRRGRPRCGTGGAGGAGAAGAAERWGRFLARALPARPVADFVDFRRLQPRVARSVLLGFELSGRYLVGWSCCADAEVEAGLLVARELAESAGFIMSDPTVLRFELYKLFGLVEGGPISPRLVFDCLLPMPTMAWVPIAAPGVPLGLQVTVAQSADEEAFVVCALVGGAAVERFKPPSSEGDSVDDDYERTRGIMRVAVVPARLASGRPGWAAAGEIPRLPRRAFSFEVECRNSGRSAAVSELRLGKCPRSGLHAVATQREDFAVIVTWFAVDLAPCAPAGAGAAISKPKSEPDGAVAALDAAAGRPYYVEREAHLARAELLARCRWPWWSEERLSHMAVYSPPPPLTTTTMGGDQDAHAHAPAGQCLEARVVRNSYLDVEVLLRRCLSYDLALPIKGAPMHSAHQCAAPELCAVALQAAAGAGAAPDPPMKRVKATPDALLAIDDFDFRLDRLTPCARWLDLHAVVRLKHWRPREEELEDKRKVGGSGGGDEDFAGAAAAPKPADGMDVGLTLRVDCHTGSYVVRDKARMALGRAEPPPLKARLERFVERAQAQGGRGDTNEGVLRTWRWDHQDPASERPLLELRNRAFPIVIHNSAAAAARCH